ncbi:hypothetical protein EI42_05322 [Thermosporothrix hazakensis]|uniref:Uncharacterized protein n=1 Tax=Thermosporothrix hazakensis TaxID=644383 RepID=A0A326UC67_THEHA|nr:hypothetical protein EI42_05322 [Thermosporothrix hazakensis]
MWIVGKVIRGVRPWRDILILPAVSNRDAFGGDSYLFKTYHHGVRVQHARSREALVFGEAALATSL